MNPTTSSSPSDLAAAIGALGSLGLESYAVSQGETVSGVSGVATVQPASQSLLIIGLIGIGVLLVIYLVLR